MQIRIDNSDQADGFAPLLEFLVDAGVIASKNADADNSDRNVLVRWQKNVLVGRMPARIVNVNAGKSIPLTRKIPLLDRGRETPSRSG